jgi:D-alanyl-D-alanine carboxypeptidase
MLKIFIPLLFLVVVFEPLYAQNFNKEKLDSLMNELHANNKAMGTVVISKNNKPVYQKSIGYSFIEGSQKSGLDKNTRYRVGSITKMFTAVLVFQLIEEGRLELSTPVAKFFSQLPNADKITIGNMLSHSSGLFDYVREWDSWRFRSKTPEEIVNIIAEKKPEFEPGTKTAYSSSNYILLGYIIEKLCSKPYAQVLKERVTSKISASDTYYGGKIDVKNKEAFSYAFENGTWKPQPETNMTAAGGAGAIVSTATDLATFIHALFSGKLISRESLGRMLTLKDGVGMGVEQLPFYHMKVYGHSGQIDLFQSWALYFPNDSVSVVYLSNGYGGVPINDVLKGILHIYYNKPYEIPNFKTIALSPEELNSYTGVYDCKQPRMRVTITKKVAGLFAQATGQSPFLLEPIGKDRFRYDAAGIVIEFLTGRKEFILKQGGGSYFFTKSE